MQPIKSLFSFYIQSSIHVALAVLSLFFISCLEYDIKPSIELILTVFLGTIASYNFVKYAEAAGLHHRSLTKSMRGIQVFSFLCTVPLLYFAFMLSREVILWLAAFGLLTSLYALPLFRQRSLRTLSGIKIIIVAIVWSGVTVIVPAAYQGVIDTDNWISFIQRVLFIVVLTIPFEIRDLKYDASYLVTIPQKLGVHGSKLLGVVLLILILILDGWKDIISLSHFYSFSITSIIMVLFLKYASEDQPKYFASFWVEALPIFWLSLFYLLRAYFNIS